MSASARLVRHDGVLLGLRLLVGVIFVYASVDKILDPAGFAIAVKNYQFLPQVLVNFWALTLPWVELAAGLLLIVGFWTRSAGALVGVMLVSFFVALVAALVRGLDISCGCFHPGGGGSINVFYLLRDALLVVLTLPLALVGGGRFSLDALWARRGC